MGVSLSTTSSIRTSDSHLEVDSEALIELTSWCQTALEPCVTEDKAETALTRLSIVRNSKLIFIKLLYLCRNALTNLTKEYNTLTLVRILREILWVELLVAIEIHPSLTHTIAEVVIALVLDLSCLIALNLHFHCRTLCHFEFLIGSINIVGLVTCRTVSSVIDILCTTLCLELLNITNLTSCFCTSSSIVEFNCSVALFLCLWEFRLLSAWHSNPQCL